MNTATITIEVDDAGATQAFRRVNAEAGKLGPTLQPIQRISEQTFNNIEGGALRAREAAALMGEEFGVHVPRALRGVLAESTAIGPALSAAFSGLALIGFIDIAKNAGEAVARFVDKLAGWSEFAKSTMDAQSALNKEIVDSIDNIKKLDKAYRLIGLEGVAKFAEQQKISNEELDAAKKKVADLTAEMKKLAAASLETRVVQRVAITGSSAIGIPSAEPTDAARKAMEQFGAVSIALASARKTLKEFGAETRNVDKELSSAFRKEQADAIRKIATATEEASVRLREITSAANRGGFTGEAQIQADALAQINAVEKIYSKEPTLAADAAAAVAAIHAEASRKRIKLLTDEADKAIRIGDEEDAAEARDKQRQLEKERRMEDETLNIERSSAVASALPWDRANVSIISSYQERMDKIREMLNTHDLDEAHAAREQAAAWNEAFGQMRDNLASQMQGLFDDITSGNIGKTFKKMFEQIVFQMVATWILGMGECARLRLARWAGERGEFWAHCSGLAGAAERTVR